MTQIQVDYWKVQEQKKANTETARHNLVQEDVARTDLDERVRHNLVSEANDARSIAINAQNAATNAMNAQSNRMQAEASKSQAESAARNAGSNEVTADSRARSVDLDYLKFPGNILAQGAATYGSLVGTIVPIIAKVLA